MELFEFSEVYSSTTTKYLLAAWKFSGSNFCSELIRENFPECFNPELWGKTHSTLSIEAYKTLSKNNIKIIFILADPRDVSVNIGYYKNGWNCDPNDYSSYGFHNRDNLVFLNENMNKINNLLSYYTTKFKDNCLVLKYEDAYYNPDVFLGNVGKFLNLKPLNINDVNKYRQDINRNIGIFPYYYTSETNDQHYNKHKSFYIKWGYGKNGYYFSELNRMNKSFLKGKGWGNINNKRFVDLLDYEINNIKYLNMLNRNKVFSMIIPPNYKNGAFNDNIENRIKKLRKK